MSYIESYRRPLVTEWQEVFCAENPHEYYARKDTEVPRTHKPDFRVAIKPWIEL
jgi:hypothetical protein